MKRKCEYCGKEFNGLIKLYAHKREHPQSISSETERVKKLEHLLSTHSQRKLVPIKQKPLPKPESKPKTSKSEPKRYGIYDMDQKYRKYYDDLKAFAKERNIRFSDYIGELITREIMLVRSLQSLREEK